MSAACDFGGLNCEFLAAVERPKNTRWEQQEKGVAPKGGGARPIFSRPPSGPCFLKAMAHGDFLLLEPSVQLDGHVVTLELWTLGLR